MSSTKDEIKSLASYVTFRQLYDNGRKDIYDIVGLFAKYVIDKRGLHDFEVSEIVDYINLEFGFRIPDYILQSALKRFDFLERKDGKFHVIKGYIKNDSNEIEEKVNNAQTVNDTIFKLLNEFVTEKLGRALSRTENSILANEFTAFLLDESSADKYGEYIGAFIVQNEGNQELFSQIQTIKEGAVLFAGLTYGGNVDENVKWNSDITIYFENEILFHLAGFNGEVFKRITEDLLKLISEMNSKAKRQIIKLRYFPEVEYEINHFFNKAQDIVMHRDIIDEDNYAMAYIVNGCATESDVLSKKASFMQLLKIKGILKEADHNYYTEENQKYNLEGKELIEKYNISDEKMRYIKHLNYVNILRKAEEYTKIKDCKHLLLTETGRILQMSKEFVSKEGQIPLAINMYLLTNRLWYDLNKGFDTNSFPASFDILLKSKIVLSSLVTKSIATKYDEAKTKFINKEISSEDLISTIVVLREEAKKPEDVLPESLDEIISFISEKDISLYRNEKIRLETSLLEYKEIVEQKLEDEKQRDISEQELKSEVDSLKLANEEQTKWINNKQEKLKEKADKKVCKKVRRFKTVSVLGIILYIALVICLYIKLNTLGQGIIALIVALAPLTIGWIYTIIRSKEFSFNILYKYFEQKYENYIHRKIYMEYEIDGE